jgi:O-antigen ligase
MANTYNFFNTASLSINNIIKGPATFTVLLAAILITIPMNFAYGSIACIIFLLYTFASVRRGSFTVNKTLLLPMALYVLMALSLLWTGDFDATLSGLRKELLLLVMPFAFLFIPNLTKETLSNVFRIYGFAMVGYALYFGLMALVRYVKSGNKEVFFYHDLVSIELNAIYVAVFASFALFYFVSLRSKKTIDRAAIFILAIFVFMLSSKSIIFIDFLLIIVYYIYFLDTPRSIKVLTILAVSAFLVFSMLFVKQVRERFMIEYETAFVDNTPNRSMPTVDNISLRQAWSSDSFTPNHFFPGGALRVYQIRIFGEMLAENNILFTGFGLEASQPWIKEKEREHNLYQGYGDYNFHNQYIQTFAELGIFGLLILVAMLFLNLKKALADRNFLHIVFAVTMIVLFLTESFFCRQRGVIFFIAMYCMFNVVRPHLQRANIQ